MEAGKACGRIRDLPQSSQVMANTKSQISNFKYQIAVRCVAGVTLGFLLAMAGLVLAKHDWNPMVFVFQGTKFNEGDSNGVAGYDGQFAYYIARDPLRASARIDAPAYRYQRILYPAIAWLLSAGGHPALLPWMMVAINVAAVTAASGLLAGLMGVRGASPWYALYALVLVVFIGTSFAVRADLNEPLALALTLLGLTLVERGQLMWAGAAFALAGLAKEVALVFAVGVGLWLVWQRKWRTAAVLLVTSLAPSLIWGTVLTTWFRQSAFSAPATALEIIPFNGFRFATPGEIVVLLFWIVLPTLWLGGLALTDLRHPAARLDALLVLANAALVASMPRNTWVDLMAACRLTLGLVIAGLLYAASRRAWLLPVLAVLWVPSAVVLAMILAW